jgi:predicted alpha-1,6-mannanase (GH76 family)
MLRSASTETTIQRLPYLQSQSSCSVYHRYEPQAGQWNTMGWWNCANAVECLTNLMIYSNSTNFTYIYSEIYDNQPASYILQDGSNDDVLWWSLAWARAYELTGNATYLTRSELCFEHVLQYWDNTCGGGIWWSSARNYKNAVTNELLLMAAVTLHKLVPIRGDYYWNWTMMEWTWFEHSGISYISCPIPFHL